MKGSDPHFYARIPSLTTNEDIFGLLASLRVDKSDISSPLVDSHLVASIHYKEFNKYLTSFGEKEQTNPTPRQKLAKLTHQQFHELCTDVYDELVRRQANLDTTLVEIPFLPPQVGFHPKRNQARFKLATLQPPRFQDLTSDLRYELGRRYPECKEESSHTMLTSPGSTYDNLPFPGIPNVPPGRDEDTRFGGTSENYPSGSAVVRTTTW